MVENQNWMLVLRREGQAASPWQGVWARAGVTPGAPLVLPSLGFSRRDHRGGTSGISGKRTSVMGHQGEDMGKSSLEFHRCRVYGIGLK